MDCGHGRQMATNTTLVSPIKEVPDGSTPFLKPKAQKTGREGGGSKNLLAV